MTELGFEMLKYSYMSEGETTAEDVFARVAKGVSGRNPELEKRIFTYLTNEWFMFATPILSNIGTDRGLPISCYVNEVEDSKDGIFSKYNENFWLGATGGGIGTDWSRVREINSAVSNKGKSSGIIPFIKISDSTVLAVSQGGLRRAAQAVYLDVSHPEIEEFIDLRREEGADNNRRSRNIHHAVKLSDRFMEAVTNLEKWDLISPKTGEVVKSVDAFTLFTKILTTRMERGEPYIFFTDNVNRNTPEYYKEKGYKVNLSNLCTEILQHTSNDKTAVCALCSLNLAKWDEWKDDTQFYKDVVIAMNNVLDEFVTHASPYPPLRNAINSVLEERNIGIGVMGFHTLLQMKRVPFEGALAVGINRKVFSTISSHIEQASKDINPLNNGKPYNVLRTAVAPTSSISIICGEVSAGIEPILANAFAHKLKIGTFIAKNPALDSYLKEVGREDEWQSIIENGGSVQHLDWMEDSIKDVFKTAYEIDQKWIIEHAATRQQWLCQGQSVNLFLESTEFKSIIYYLHILAWRKGLTCLYYLRSTAPKRASVSKNIESAKYDECLACQ